MTDKYIIIFSVYNITNVFRCFLIIKFMQPAGSIVIVALTIEYSSECMSICVCLGQTKNLHRYKMMSVFTRNIVKLYMGKYWHCRVKVKVTVAL